MTAPLLELVDVCVSVGRTRILEGVSLSVEPGSAVGLVGETGSGKTMTVRTATGLLHGIGGKVTSGSVRVAGVNVTRASDRQWRRWQGRTVALVPQSSMSSLDPLMVISKQLREAVRLAGKRAGERAEVERLLAAVQLEPTAWLLHAHPHELSGGMRQRVMIALALAGDPALLVADEPTTALDAAVRHEILDLLGTLRREKNLGLLLISHDISAIEAATDVTVVMYGGRTIESGPTSLVVGDPLHPYTRALIGALPERTAPGSRIPAIGGQAPLPGEIVTGCSFAPRCPVAIVECGTTRPALTEVGADRLVRCLLADGSGAAQPPSAEVTA
jgi:peptide/nickel transport system ATP-binding protein